MRRLAPLLLVLCVFGAGASDDDIAALLREGRLTIASDIRPAAGVVPGQKLTLEIEIATDSWFSGGTRIRVPEVPGLVILQTGQFAANATEQRGGATWVVQRWALDVYPQRAGTFTVGPVALQLAVGGSAGTVEGGATSPPVSFSAALPESLKAVDFWVAAPQFSVEQQFDRALEGLVPGDAFERTVTFEARDTMAMMLPPLEAEALAGLAAYPSPPVLDNYNNRGEVRARRTQAITYMVEAPGSYLLPARDFYWWDSASAELKLVSLPATAIEVAGEATAGPGSDHKNIRLRLTAIALGAAAVFALLLWSLLRYRPWRWLGILSEPWANVRALLQSLRRPALPKRLNPGSSAGD